jgi:hypothetical protein
MRVEKTEEYREWLDALQDRGERGSAGSIA